LRATQGQHLRTNKPTQSGTFPGKNRHAAIAAKPECLRSELHDLTGIYARWHMFEQKREAVMAIEAAVLALYD